MLISIGRQPDHGFDEPLGLMSDCHRRVEKFLGAMLTVARSERGQPLSDPSRRLLEQSVRYFTAAAPRHTADEEISLFPRLRTSLDSRAREVMSVVDRLEADHRVADEAHATADRLARRWIDHGALPDEEASELVTVLETLERLYETHIAAEENAVYPTAHRVLSPSDLTAIGHEMAERRGIPYEPPAELRRA